MDNGKSPFGLKLSSVLNFRDLGGITAAENKKVRSGIIFRSANPDTISRRDLKKLHQLNIKTIIDLRAPSEQKRKRNSLGHIELLSLPLDFQQKTRERLMPYFRKKNSETIIADISNSLYLEMVDATRDIIGAVLDALLSGDRSPVLIHCHAGKDRTGILSALILLALGAERELIISDFMKSNDALLPFFKRKLYMRKVLSFGFFPASTVLFAVTVRQRNIESVLDRISVHYGGIEGYLESAGFDTTLLAKLKERTLC